jgi:hypothetical protein
MFTENQSIPTDLGVDIVFQESEYIRLPAGEFSSPAGQYQMPETPAVLVPCDDALVAHVKKAGGVQVQFGTMSLDGSLLAVVFVSGLGHVSAVVLDLGDAEAQSMGAVSLRTGLVPLILQSPTDFTVVLPALAPTLRRALVEGVEACPASLRTFGDAVASIGKAMSAGKLWTELGVDELTSLTLSPCLGRSSPTVRELEIHQGPTATEVMH